MLKRKFFSTLAATLAIAFTLILGGCGQKGELYLPDSQPEETGS